MTNSSDRFGYGTTFTPGSLHGPAPDVPIALIRAHIRLPLDNDPIVPRDRVNVLCNVQLVLVSGSGLTCTS